MMVPFADIIYGCDEAWWNHYHDKVKDYPGEKWTMSKQASKKFGINHIHGDGAAKGISRKRGHIPGGGNSGHQAIGLSFLMGAAKIVLLGYDMMATGGKSHWHGDHPKPLVTSVTRFTRWIQRMGGLAMDLKANHCTVINSSRHTALFCFPKMPLEEALQ